MQVKSKLHHQQSAKHYQSSQERQETKYSNNQDNRHTITLPTAEQIQTTQSNIKRQEMQQNGNMIANKLLFNESDAFTIVSPSKSAEKSHTVSR